LVNSDQGGIWREDWGTCPGHWISKYGTEWPILCWCATATRSRPPHWLLYLQIPPWTTHSNSTSGFCQSIDLS